MKILLVEDNVEVASALGDVILAWLENKHVEIDYVTKAADAVYNVFMNDYDLVLMDIGLTTAPVALMNGMQNDNEYTPPGFDGCLTALAIRGLGEPKGKTPIIAISGNLKVMDPGLEKAANFACKLQKPIIASELKEAILNCLNEEPEDGREEGTQQV